MLNQLAQTVQPYTTYTPTTTSAASPSAGMALYIVAFGGVGVILTLIFLVSLWKIFTKAGRPGWAAIVPFYSFWVYTEVAGKPGWYSLVT